MPRLALTEVPVRHPVWTVTTTPTLFANEDDCARLHQWLVTHGIHPEGRLMEGTTVGVYLTGDALFVVTWLATDPLRHLCPYCPECVQQVMVQVPLVATPPALPGAWTSHLYGHLLGAGDAGS